jgi:hypothetical protein
VSDLGALPVATHAAAPVVRRVLVLAVTRPPDLALRTALADFKALDVEVDLAFLRQPETDLPEDSYRSMKVFKARRGVGDAEPPQRYSKRWWRVLARNVVVTHALARVPMRSRVWLMARFDHDVRDWARQADVLVALDRYAVYPVWRLARLYTRPAAVHGFDAALRLARASHPGVQLPAGPISSSS